MTSGQFSSLPPRSARHVKKRRFSFKKILLIALGLILLFSIGYTIYLYGKFENMLTQMGTEDSVEPDETADKKPVSILLLGVDTRAVTGSLNTDVIMVAALNPQDKSAAVVSVPRDTYINPAGYSAHKANAFYAIEVNDDKEKALENVKNIFGEFLDIPIDYAVVIDFQTFEAVIDELGGIWVDVDMDMRYVDNADGTNINLKKGYQKLTGKQALDFVRYRKSNRGTADSSDISRNERQQKVIAAVIEELSSVKSITSLDNIFEAVGEHVQTDIPKAQIKSLIRTYAGISVENVEFIKLEGSWRSPYIYIDPESLEKAKGALKSKL